MKNRDKLYLNTKEYKENKMKGHICTFLLN